jgi:hypothetical protein
LGIIENLQSTLDVWNKRLDEVWSLLSTSPKSFKGGSIWNTVVGINGSLQAIGYALLVLFFVVGLVNETTKFSEIKRPEVAFRLFMRFAIAKAVISYGMEIMVGIFDICQGVVSTIIGGLSSPAHATVPQVIVDAVADLSIWDKIGVWAISLIGGLVIAVMSFIMLYTIYSRFIRLYIYTAIAPLPLASFAGQATSATGKTFLKSYAGVCLESAVIVLACILFGSFVSAEPTITAGATASKMLWEYILQVTFNLFVLTASVKMANVTVKSMLGL